MPDRNLYNNPIIAKKDLTLEDLFVMCFCIIDDQYKLLFASPKYWRNSNNYAPEFTDPEVLTIGLVKELCRVKSF
ncbi:MAG: hypothetical protein HZA78_07785 [Candidatus Schekmanbacteria bacterium]|nr:hypothetical protein [Candidatus Schekmanbacteria bacterium]